MISKTKWASLVAAGVLTAFVGGLMLASAGPAERPAARRNAPVPEKPVPKWKQDFDAVYSLKADEVVKVIPRADQPKSRRDFIRDRLLTHDNIKPEHVEKQIEDREARYSYAIILDAGGKRWHTWDIGGITAVPTNGPPYYEGVSIFGLPSRLGGFERFEIESDPRVNDVMFLDNPDFVVRKDAPRDKLIPALDKALREQLKVKFRLDLEPAEREVWVASGTVEIKPRAWRKAGQVDVYSDEANVNKETFNHAHNLTPGYETGDVKKLLAQIQDTVGTSVMWTDDTPPAKPRFDWTCHWLKPNVPWEERKADRDAEKVLKVVAEQTGLTIAKEKRKVPVLFIRPLK